ncbi:hypothetical protein BGAL_0348g00170 [Botrytis galanthina]|uniref:chitinase n=1 Tax=Botrytis galanthina TaxID=278940 RepID=A0A4V4HTU9_9HELO|nr:hypothetical protein BGAL_0348g00170 [Botrytis galanthina]
MGTMLPAPTMSSNAIYSIYLASWHNFVPESSSVSEITHVCLAFVSPSLFINPEPPSPSALEPFFTNTSAIRSQFPKNVKVLWALGGWGDTESFGVAARDETSRKLFAKNIKSLLDITNTDGKIGNGDDYKQPGTTNSAKTWEVDAFSKLVSELRSAIGPDKILSAAVPGLPRDMMAFGPDNIRKLVPHIDFFNIMTYDLMNRRDNVTAHHAGIEGSLEAVDRYIQNGVPPHKAILGFAFYAKWFKIIPLEEHHGPIRSPLGLPTVQMEDPDTGDDLGKSGAFVWSENPSTSVETSFKRAMALGQYDDRHEGHYFLDEDESVFWSWETPEAIVRKFKMVMQQKGLGGVFAWELGGDSRDWSHVKALNDVVKEAKSSGEKKQHRTTYYLMVRRPTLWFTLQPTFSFDGCNALVSNNAPSRPRAFTPCGDMDMDKSLEEYRDAMMKAFKEPLSNRDISDIWDNLQERPTHLCGAGKSLITWDEVWKSLVDVYGVYCLKEAVSAATKACNKGGHAPKRNSTPEILVMP